MSRTIVIYCIRVMAAVLLWAVAMTTLAAVCGWIIDLTAVLTFCGTAFGGELLLLAFKRIFAGNSNDE